MAFTCHAGAGQTALSAGLCLGLAKRCAAPVVLQGQEPYGLGAAGQWYNQIQGKTSGRMHDHSNGIMQQ